MWSSTSTPTPPPDRNRLLPGITIADDIDVSAMTTGFHTMAVLAALRGQPNRQSVAE
ncbi:hypothetical protein ACFWIN_09750 [Streptomyces sp. NPDC127049]|uniref:hypothetical protein n=1 Tax=Streptomyces sp. NPDC127049 TaxID=3347118 RepID=UPI003666F62A